MKGIDTCCIEKEKTMYITQEGLYRVGMWNSPSKQIRYEHTRMFEIWCDQLCENKAGL